MTCSLVEFTKAVIDFVEAQMYIARCTFVHNLSLRYSTSLS